LANHGKLVFLISFSLVSFLGAACARMKLKLKTVMEACELIPFYVAAQKPKGKRRRNCRHAHQGRN